MNKTLQFDYFPVMRSQYVANELVTQGELNDVLDVFWNNIPIFNHIELSKETSEKKNVFRTCNIELSNSTVNTLLLKNTQSLNAKDKMIELSAEIKINQKTKNWWETRFTYNLFSCNQTDLQMFNEQFGINTECFHFKINGEVLLCNQNVSAGSTWVAEKEFFWQGVNPIMFEIEEYGHGSSIDSRFIQIVRFTIL